VNRLLAIQDVAEQLSISVKTVYTMCNQRRIPFVKVGRLLRFDAATMEEWVRKQAVNPLPVNRL